MSRKKFKIPMKGDTVAALVDTAPKVKCDACGGEMKTNSGFLILGDGSFIHDSEVCYKKAQPNDQE